MALEAYELLIMDEEKLLLQKHKTKKSLRVSLVADMFESVDFRRSELFRFLPKIR